MSAKAVFLDRDGTIIPETGARSADPGVRPLPEAIRAIRKLRDAGFLIVVVTNQAAIARGFYSEYDLAVVHEKLLERFAHARAPIDAIYYCPHLPDGSVPQYAVDCDCRKPKPGLILRAARQLDVDLARSYLIGDSERDVQAARAAGCKAAALIRPAPQDTFRLDFGGAPEWKRITDQIDDASDTDADAIVPDIEAAADWVVEMESAQ